MIIKDINSRQIIVCKYKEDCIVRNLYVIFREMEYTNGLKFVDICKERPYGYIDYQLASLNGRRDKGLQKRCEDFEKVKAWADLFVPVFKLYKQDGYFKENVEIKRYIKVSKIKGTLAKIDLKSMCDKIDRVFREHGYDFVKDTH